MTAVSSRIAIAVVIVVGVATRDSAAQPAPNSAAATAQFDQGRALMKEKKYAEACVAFERSQKLEPAPGTLFNLANCYVQIGKLATAWAAYRDLASRDPNKTRKKASADQAAALSKRLPKLTLEVTTPATGLVITLDGIDVTNLVGAETPIDLGAHVIEARAPKFTKFSTTTKITAADEGKRVAITITLVPEGAGKTEPTKGTTGTGTTSTGTTGTTGTGTTGTGTTGTTGTGNIGTTTGDVTGTTGTPTNSTGPVDSPPRSNRKRNGILLGATGAVFALGGVFVGKLARDKWDEARALCGEDLQCDNAGQLDAGNQLVKGARLRANVSTGLVIGGVAMVGVGAFLIFTAPKRETARTVRVTPTAGPAHAGILVEGRF